MSDENPVRCEDSNSHVRVTANNEIVADTRNALLVQERGHEPVWYIPPGDIVRERFSQTDHTTHCPRKGDATYWTITAGGEEVVNAAWSYEEPFPQVDALKGFVSFYTDRVEISVDTRDSNT